MLSRTNTGAEGTLPGPLPFLPGNAFDDKLPKTSTTQTRKSQTLRFVGGMPVVVGSVSSPSKARTASLPPPTGLPSEDRVDSPSSCAPGGAAEEVPSASGQPLCLRFFGFFRESVSESAEEASRVRKCVVFVHLDDETIHIMEPRSDNSGIPQGAMLKRHRVPREDGEGFLGIDDFQVGEEVMIYGKAIHMADCDEFTQRYLTEHGRPPPSASAIPDNPYDTTRLTAKRSTGLQVLRDEDKELKRFFECSFTGRPSVPSASEKTAAQKFLSSDRKVLRFFCAWDDRGALYGDLRHFNLCYYLANDTVQLTEIVPPNSGRDASALFFARQKVAGVECPADLFGEGLGVSVEIASRVFFLYDCDENTRTFLREDLGLPEDMTKRVPPPRDEEAARKEAAAKAGGISAAEPPPHDGIGDEEDTLNNWRYLVLKPPRKDVKKLLEHEKTRLRFEARFVECSPEDSARKFVITYYVADDTISIFEPMQRNTGIIGGRFLERTKIPHLRSPDKLFVGAEVEINAYKFEVIGTDEATLKFMEDRPKEFSLADVNRVLHKLRETLHQRHQHAREAFRYADRDHSGYITFEEFKEMLGRALQTSQEPRPVLNEQEMITLMRFFDRNGNGRISYGEFVEALTPPGGVSSPRRGGGDAVPREIFSQADEESERVAREMDAARAREVQAQEGFKRLVRIHETRPLLLQEALRKAVDRSSDSLIGPEELRGLFHDQLRVGFPSGEFDALCEKFFAPPTPLPTRPMDEDSEVPPAVPRTPTPFQGGEGVHRIDIARFVKRLNGTDTWTLSTSKL